MDNTHYTPEEPIAAIATALYPSALGVIRTSGKGCVELAAKVFSRPRALLNAEGNSIVYGWLVNQESSSQKEKTNEQERASSPQGGEENAGFSEGEKARKRIDEVLISVFRAPKSYTGEDMVEISCHGGVAVVRGVFALLLECGFRQAERGEFTLRAFLNGKADLTRAEAVREIIDSRTAESSSRACSRLSGDLKREIDSSKKLITDALAAIEVDIEYPEDEHAIAESIDGGALLKLFEAREKLSALVDSWQAERVYRDGAKIVLAGKTNAGKSSLFNALLKEERSIVSANAGTTRDWIESEVSFAGIPARLYDTAGIRGKLEKTKGKQTQKDGEDAIDPVEAAGIKRAKELAKDADLIICLEDASEAVSLKEGAPFPLSETADFLTLSQANTAESAENTAEHGGETSNHLRPLGTTNAPSSRIPLILAFNKTDKLTQAELSSLKEQSEQARKEGKLAAAKLLFISAKTGKGIGELVSAVKAQLTGGSSSARAVSPGSERQKDAIADSLFRVDHALLTIKEGTPGLDAAVQDLEDALDSLGEVTGEVTSDDILNSIFSNFCVGK